MVSFDWVHESLKILLSNGEIESTGRSEDSSLFGPSSRFFEFFWQSNLDKPTLGRLRFAYWAPRNLPLVW